MAPPWWVSWHGGWQIVHTSWRRLPLGRWWARSACGARPLWPSDLLHWSTRGESRPRTQAPTSFLKIQRSKLYDQHFWSTSISGLKFSNSRNKIKVCQLLNLCGQSLNPFSFRCLLRKRCYYYGKGRVLSKFSHCQNMPIFWPIWPWLFTLSLWKIPQKYSLNMSNPSVCQNCGTGRGG